MRFIARFAMRGPYFAAASAAALLLGSLSVGLLLIPSGAVIALVTLRHGAREGARALLIAASFALVVRFALAGDLAPMAMLCALAWLPAWTMALALAYRRQQAYPLLVAAVLVGAYAVAMRVMVGDVTAFWSARLAPLFELLAKGGGTSFTAEQMVFIARQLHVWSLVGIHSVLAGMILLGRWWQSVLFNPDGFGSEFREFDLPRAALVALLAASVLFALDRAATLGLAVAGDGLAILVVLFAFQGLAVIHFRARVMSLANGWLTALYVMLMVMPQVVGPLLATTGVADALADFRRLRGPREPA